VKLKEIGLGSPGASHGLSKRQKAPKLTKSVSKWVTSGYILLYKWFRPQMAFKEFMYFNTC